MKRILGILLSSALMTCASVAQPPAQNPMPIPGINKAPTTQKEFEDAVYFLGKKVAYSENRIKQYTGEMIKIDEGIERKISRIIKNLSSVADSVESRTRVAQNKTEAIEGLKRSIKFYMQERDKRFAELNRRYPQMTREDLSKDVEKLNARIEERIGQVVDIAASFTQHKDIKKYNHYYDGWRDYEETNPAWRQNQMVVTRGENVKEDVVVGLQKSIDLLEQENEKLRRTLEAAGNEEQKDILRKQIRANEEAMEKRWYQIEDNIMAKKPKTKEVGRKNAIAMENMINEMVAQVRRDHNELVRLKTERDRQRANLKSSQTRLEYCKKQLAQLDQQESAPATTPKEKP